MHNYDNKNFTCLTSFSDLQLLQKDELKELISSRGVAMGSARSQTKNSQSCSCSLFFPIVAANWFSIGLIEALLNIPTVDQPSQHTVNEIVSKVSTF
jgi:hypothetical protein